MRKVALYNILIDFGIPMNLVRLIKLYLSETSSRVRVGIQLSDTFPIKKCLTQGDSIMSLLLNSALEYAIRKVKVNQDG
jgi:hypothetical protein